MKTKNDRQIRMRYYGRLGISEMKTKKDGPEDSCTSTRRNRTTPKLRSSLKNPSSTSSSTALQQRHSTNNKRVSFYERVVVNQIPSHREYDDKTRALLWSTEEERMENRRADVNNKKWGDVMKEIYQSLLVGDIDYFIEHMKAPPLSPPQPHHHHRSCSSAYRQPSHKLPSYRSSISRRKHKSWEIEAMRRACAGVANPNEATMNPFATAAA